MARGGVLVGLDVGTTSVRSVLFDLFGRTLRQSSARQRTRTPAPGWVEQDAEEIFRLSVRTLRDVVPRRTPPAAVGLTNQRESLVAVDAGTGRALAPVVLWQDGRTASLASELSEEGWGGRCWDQGGLPLTTYPTAPKMLWMLRNVRAVREAARRDRLLFGTLDSWIIYRLLGGARRSAPWLTDATNASRTLLYDLSSGAWSPALLDHFQVASGTLAAIRPSFGAIYGELPKEILGIEGVPLASDLGDQQAGLLGVAGFREGAAKLTLGTGGFFLAEGAPEGSGRREGLIRTVLWEDDGRRRAFGLEGGVGTVGAFLEWLGPHGIGLFSSPQAVGREAAKGSRGNGVHFVPALSGLFAPHWRPMARAALLGASRATRRGDLALAALDGVGHRVADIVDAHARARGGLPTRLWVDGGLSRSDPLLRSIADLSGVTLYRSTVTEATARGAALAAGISVGVVGRGHSFPPPTQFRGPDGICRPRLPARERTVLREVWGVVVSKLPDGALGGARGPSRDG